MPLHCASCSLSCLSPQCTNTWADPFLSFQSDSHLCSLWWCKLVPRQFRGLLAHSSSCVTATSKGFSLIAGQPCSLFCSQWESTATCFSTTTLLCTAVVELSRCIQLSYCMLTSSISWMPRALTNSFAHSFLTDTSGIYLFAKRLWDELGCIPLEFMDAF